MAGGGVSSIKSRKSYRALTTVLASAFLEWLLMLLLFIDAIFAYLITQFARYCELPVPCLLCSRLDHIFDGEKVGFYWDLMCGNHKSEISSLVLCHFHNKLVDVHRMCETCLFSFATKDKSNAETYRLLVGKLGVDQGTGTDEAPVHDDHNPTSSRMKTCSCCGQLWNSRPQTRSLLQTKSFESEGSDLDVPLFDEFRQKGNDVKTTRFSAESALAGSIDEDSSSSFMYKELEVTSDVESEGHRSQEANSTALVLDTNYSREDIGMESVQMEHKVGTLAEDSPCAMEHGDEDSRALVLDMNYSQEDIRVEHGLTEREVKKLAEDSTCEMELETRTLVEDSTHVRTIDLVSIHDNEDFKPLICETNSTQEALAMETFEMEPLIVTPTEDPNLPVELGIPVYEHGKSTDLLQSEISKDHDDPSAGSISIIGHGLEELNWEAGVMKGHPSSVPDLIGINDVPESSNAGDEKSDPPSLPELIIIDNAPKSSSFADVLMEQSADTRGSGEVEQAPVDESGKTIEVENESTTADVTASRMATDLSNCNQQLANDLDFSDAYKLAVSNKGRQLSGKLLDQHTGKDSTRVSGDLRLLWSQLSPPHGFDLPVKDFISPRVSGNLDEYWKSYDPSVSIGMQLLQKRISLERNDSRISLNESSVESLDLGTVGEIEGESELDRLKRQVEHDRKLMSALCKELEEERNASAIAANQAMAMITRLQEEKATVRMEALQELRMMEGEAELDAEALEKLNDLLQEKEREIQDLETELEVYREKLANESPLEMAAEPSSGANLAGKRRSVSEQFASQLTYEVSGRSDELFIQNTKSSSKDTLFEFEDEKLYISRSLNKLEKKLHLFSNTGLSNGDIGSDGEEVTDSKLHEEGSQMASEEAEVNDALPPADHFISRSNRRSLVRRVHSFSSPKSVVQGSLVNKDADAVTLAYELSSLNDRLLALEVDRNFLEHAINSLRNADEGFHFIKEIASHLRELRRIGVRRQQVSA
ncbi:hypothetical protein Dimus_021814 [Dionaea muscipula]